MPELPEVETTRNAIAAHIIGQKISHVIIRQAHLRWIVPSALQRILVQQSFSCIERRGKYLLLKAAAGTLIIHLGMSGHLRITTAQSPAQKHDHVDIKFSNNTVLRYTDPRRFGAILWTKEDPLQHSLLKNLGPEPLSPAFSGHYLFQYTRKRRLNIKQLLMDSKAVVGVGNIYANEALFKAKIHPQRLANQLSQMECATLVKAVKTILKKAIAAGGTSLKDFVSADGKPGYFQQELLVYGRENQKCIDCSTLLTKLMIAQRATVYCAKCQAL